MATKVDSPYKVRQRSFPSIPGPYRHPIPQKSLGGLVQAPDKKPKGMFGRQDGYPAKSKK